MVVHTQNGGAHAKWWCARKMVVHTQKMVVHTQNGGAHAKWWCTRKMVVHT